ncbi:MAG: thymidine kinase [Bacteroidetes bacterium]|nr:thymidine kinase [Bacteroidota bacterium]
MFLENTANLTKRLGWIEVICGSMFSGKTEELIRRLNRARIAKQRVEIFKPEIDKRYDEINVVSHNENSIRSIPVQSSSQILMFIEGCDVIGIDEAQFLDADLPAVCNYIANQGIRVIVAGLDMDFQGNPFGPIPAIMSAAEYVTKVHAICMRCGDLAHYSHRTVQGDKLVMLGEKESYEPLCRKCYLDQKVGWAD